MMAAAVTPITLLERLPQVRGRYTEGADLSRVTWFRVGGEAEVLFKPVDLDDLAAFLQNKPADVEVMLLGVGSNLLVRDGGIEGVVIRLGRAFAGVTREGDRLRCGAAALDLNVAEAARRESLSGLEFLCGVPGTIGGALRMNAGAYGSEIKDILVEAKVLDPQGKLHRLSRADFGFSYRSCQVPGDWIFVEALLEGKPGDPQEIATRMGEIQAARSGSQPIRSRTGGSTFKNPEGQKAWQLIDLAGCRGLRVGGAQVSEQHCNFLINLGEASARDLENLGEEVRRRVEEATGIALQWEIKRVGKSNEEEQR